MQYANDLCQSTHARDLWQWRYASDRWLDSFDDRVAPKVALRHEPPNPLASVIEGASLVESLVIHERVIIPTPRPYGAIFKRDPLLAPFIEAGIVELRHDPLLTDSLTSMLPPDALNQGMERLAFQTGLFQASLGASLSIADSFAPSTIGLWRVLEDTLIASRPSARRSGRQAVDRLENAIARLRAVRLGQANLSLLSQTYARLSKFTDRRLELLRSNGACVPIVLRPIAATVFAAAPSYEGLGIEALKLRDELRPARRAFEAYEAAVIDDGLTIGERISITTDLQRAMDDLLADKERGGLLGITTWKSIAEIAASADLTIGGVLGTAAKLMGDPAKAAARKWRSRKIGFLREVKERFEGMKYYANSFDRLFGWQPSRRDEEQVRLTAEWACSMVTGEPTHATAEMDWFLFPETDGQRT